MRTAIVYYSQHHGNTKKLLEAISAKHEVTLINVLEEKEPDLSSFERIGFASGIYYGSFAKQLLLYARNHLPENKKVFFLYSCGMFRDSYLKAIRSITEEKRCEELGSYQCLGFVTYGPFKLVGGLAKGHPTQEEITGALRFYESLPE